MPAIKLRSGLLTLAAVGLLAAGAALRIAVAFPSHRFPADSDQTLSALCAFKVLRGFHPVFYSGVRLGSLVSYLLALLFGLFGISRDMLALEPLLVDLLLLVVWFAFLRVALEPRLALLALVFAALPAPAFSWLKQLPDGYNESLLFCAAAFWLAALLARGEERRWCGFGLGLAIGLGFWNSFMTLTCTVPALGWAGWRRPELLRRRSLALLVGAGFVAGALPWIAYNLRHPLGSFHDNFAVRAASGIMAALDNAVYVLREDIPLLLVGGAYPTFAHERWVRLIPLAIVALAFVFFFVARAPFRRTAGQPRGPADPVRALWPLVVLTVIAVVGIKAISAPGSIRGGTSRYIMPLYLIVPPVLAAFVAACAQRSKALAATLVSLLLAYDLGCTPWPWTALRRRQADQARAQEALLASAHRQGIGALAGPYWQVYSFNFLSLERTPAVPLEPETDTLFVEARLPLEPVRWGLVTTDARLLERWTRGACLQGAIQGFPPNFFLFVPRPNPPDGGSPHRFLDRLRRAMLAGGDGCQVAVVPPRERSGPLVGDAMRATARR